MKMKRLAAILLVVILCLSLCAGCGNYIGKDKAKGIALADAGLNEAEIRDFECELDKEHGVAVYEIEFKVGFTEYEYDIAAATGEILKSKVD